MKIIRVYMLSGRVYEHETTDEGLINIQNMFDFGIGNNKSISFKDTMYFFDKIERIAIEEVSEEEIEYKKKLGYKPWENDK